MPPARLRLSRHGDGAATASRSGPGPRTRLQPDERPGRLPHAVHLPPRARAPRRAPVPPRPERLPACRRPQAPRPDPGRPRNPARTAADAAVVYPAELESERIVLPGIADHGFPAARYGVPDAGAHEASAHNGPVMRLSRPASLFLLAFGVWTWVIWPTFIRNIWKDPRSFHHGATGFLVVHVALAVVSTIAGTGIGWLGWRGLRASREATPAEPARDGRV